MVNVCGMTWWSLASYHAFLSKIWRE